MKIYLDTLDEGDKIVISKSSISNSSSVVDATDDHVQEEKAAIRLQSFFPSFVLLLKVGGCAIGFFWLVSSMDIPQLLDKEIFDLKKIETSNQESNQSSLPPLPPVPSHVKRIPFSSNSSKNIPLIAGKLGDVSSFEVRGVWLATVQNIDWPSESNLSKDRQQKSLIEILDLMQELHLNTVYFQVRSQGDAFYRSSYEPWSRYLNSNQTDPGWDPLDFIIEQAKTRNIQVHAWINPYRAGFRGQKLHQKNIGSKFPQYLYQYGSFQWLDPGAPDIQNHILKVVEDIATRYDVAGIHFDDYFYPYPEEGKEFPDQNTYTKSRSILGKDDWRRENVNSLVAQVSKITRREGIEFSISPFGIYKPNHPPGIKGLSQFDSLYSDPLHWVSSNTVDRLIPQLYWPTNSQYQDYEKLLTWWNSKSRVLSGNALYKLTSQEFPIKEIMKQLEANKDAEIDGFVLFSAKHLKELRN
jgi:uncharacterized lipoprotein YddW (UPF0748 family)